MSETELLAARGGGCMAAAGRAEPLLLEGGAAPASSERAEALGMFHPRLGAFCTLLRLLALRPADKDARPGLPAALGRLAHLLGVWLLVSWSFLGWSVRAGYAAAGVKMPAVAGWFEIAESTDETIPSGLALTSMVVMCYAFLFRHFQSNCSRLRRVAGVVYDACPEDAPVVGRELRMHIRFVYVWSAAATLVGRFGTIRWDSDDTPVLHSAAGQLAVDWTVTLLSFPVQFGTVCLFWLYTGALCALHVRHVRALSGWVSDGGCCASGCVPASCASDSPAEIHARYESVLRPVKDTSRMHATVVTAALGLYVVGAATVVVDLALASGSATEQLGYVMRTGYLVAFGVPTAMGLWRASTVASEAQDFFCAVYRSSVTDPVAATFLRTYFLAAERAGDLSFRLFGMPLERVHLVRGLYIMGVLFGSLLQYRLTTRASES